jgi:formylmethanofuran dehydrogenase subunit D
MINIGKYEYQQTVAFVRQKSTPQSVVVMPRGCHAFIVTSRDTSACATATHFGATNPTRAKNMFAILQPGRSQREQAIFH